MSGARTYGDRRPYAVPYALADVTGPNCGAIELPPSLGWTGRRRYDLDDPADIRTFYERVIVEALVVDDLTRSLDPDRLHALWADLYLPERARRAWEARFPGLTRS